MSGSRADDTIEPYHERIRRAVLDRAPDRAPRAATTARSRRALSGTGTAEQLARHWYGAGDVDHAAGHARRAGDEARAKLDFDLLARAGTRSRSRARSGPRPSAALCARSSPTRSPMPGRPREAADRIPRAPPTAPTQRPRSSCAAARRARCSSPGYVNEGLELTRKVLAGVGLAMAKTPMRALMSMLLRRAWLRIRGLGFKPRSLAEISQAELTRVDVCEGVSFGLAMVDSFRGDGLRDAVPAARAAARRDAGACRARSRSRPTSSPRLAQVATARSELLDRLEEMTRRARRARRRSAADDDARLRRLLRPQPVSPRARPTSPMRSRAFAPTSVAPGSSSTPSACSAAGRSTTSARSASCRGVCRRWPRPRRATATATRR